MTSAPEQAITACYGFLLAHYRTPGAEPIGILEASKFLDRWRLKRGDPQLPLDTMEAWTESIFHELNRRGLLELLPADARLKTPLKFRRFIVVPPKTKRQQEEEAKQRRLAAANRPQKRRRR